MDTIRFDHLTKALSTAGARRTVLQLLGSLPLLGGLDMALGEAKTDAAKRRKRAHQHGKVTASKKHKKHKHKKKCKPQSVAMTCAGKCGTVTNNCKKPVDCGSCVCDPSCPVCQTCDATSGTCVPNLDVAGDVCGDGQVCRANGACTCNATSCGACRTCGGDGSCSPPTCGGSGCCNGVSCQPGTSSDACGTGGATCQSCDDGNPCTMDACGADGQCSHQAVADGTPCGDGKECSRGVCAITPTCIDGNHSCSLDEPTLCCSDNCLFPPPHTCGCSQIDQRCYTDASCCAGLFCVGFVCQATYCAVDADTCSATDHVACSANPLCGCYQRLEGGVRCVQFRQSTACGECTTDADCTALGLPAGTSCILSSGPSCGCPLDKSGACGEPCQSVV